MVICVTPIYAQTLASGVMIGEVGNHSFSTNPTSFPSAPAQKRQTAGLIIIGDEILKGQVLDTNSHFICKSLYALGVKVARISVIGDNIDEIAQEVRQFASTFDVVFTTGGIGPTHDDMTYAGVAKAFNENVTVHSEMEKLIDKWFGRKGIKREVALRMAQLPANARLIFEPDLPLASFPIVVVHNVYVFPGVPSFVERMFPRLKAVLGVGENNVFHTGRIYINKDELSITPQIDLAMERFKETVVFGSYPVFGNLYYSTRITMESNNANHVQEAKDFLSELMPQNSIVEYDDRPLETATAKVYEICGNPDHELHIVVKQAVTVSLC